MLYQDNLLISIIVPIYCVEQYIARCVDSIIDQSFCNIEIILVIDGSPDDCGKICDEYAENDNRITVLHNKNGGVTSARRSGVEKASGKYVMFVDGDDVISQDCVELLSEPLMSRDYDIVLGSLESIPLCFKLMVPFEGSLNANQYLDYLLTGNVIWGPVCRLYKRSFFVLFDCFAPDFIKLGEDAIMNIKIALEAKDIYFVDKIVYLYYLHSGSATSTLSRNFNSSVVFLENMLKPIEEKGRENEFNKSISVMKFKWWIDQIYNCQSLPFPNRYIFNLLKSVERGETYKGIAKVIYDRLENGLIISVVVSYIIHFKVRFIKFKAQIFN